jgi:hypothetical protein
VVGHPCIPVGPVNCACDEPIVPVGRVCNVAFDGWDDEGVVGIGSVGGTWGHGGGAHGRGRWLVPVAAAGGLGVVALGVFLLVLASYQRRLLRQAAPPSSSATTSVSASSPRGSRPRRPGTAAGAGLRHRPGLPPRPSHGSTRPGTLAQRGRQGHPGGRPLIGPAGPTTCCSRPWWWSWSRWCRCCRRSCWRRWRRPPWPGRPWRRPSRRPGPCRG